MQPMLLSYPTLRRFIIGTISFCYLGAVIFDYKRFTLWDQITDVLRGNVTLDLVYEILLQAQAHSLRLALMSPVYFISDFFDLEPDFVFSFFVLAALMGTYVVTVKCLRVSGIHSGYLGVFLFLLGVSFLMNGRLSFAFFGNTSVMFLLMKREIAEAIKLPRFIFLLLLSLWFSSVSTGTFIVGVSTIALFYILSGLMRAFRGGLGFKFLASFIGILSLLLFLTPTIILYFEKNLYFFFSFKEFIQHGVLRYVDNPHLYLIPIALVVLYVFGSILHFKVSKDKLYLAPFSLMLSAMAVGVFGDSSFFSGLTGFVVYIFLEMTRGRRFVYPLFKSESKKEVASYVNSPQNTVVVT